MSVGNVRYLRMEPSVKSQSDIDGVVDPSLLAHRLLNLSGRVEQHTYSRKLRLSSIAGVCVRERLIGLRRSITAEIRVPLGLRVTFDSGTGIHDFMQNTNAYFGDKRLGWWRCRACGHRQFGTKPKEKCPKCNALKSAFVYSEHSLKLPEDIPVSGHPDMFVNVGPGDIRIADFKSINGDEFDRLSSPKAEHAIQVVGYMKYIGLDDTLPIRVNTERGLVIYVSKKHTVKKLPFKAFHVVKSPVFIKLIENKVELFKRGLDDETFLPDPETVCVGSKFSCWTAKECPVLSWCIGAYR
ncbi:MAG: hypothetical protein LBQ51_02345 [Desulfovibrio sp.]|jgi:rubrerythrin|nr:hypothetical protein [Desulfovibrio sp.]